MDKELANLLIKEIVEVVDELRTFKTTTDEDNTKQIFCIQKLKLIGGIIRAKEKEGNTEHVQ